MRTGCAALIASLLLSLMGCRDLGSYLSPEELDACESGERTEGCPANTEPSATVTFLEPHVLVANAPYAPAGLGRYLELRFRVESALDIERVDVACQGLQLASWRPRERRPTLELEATVDLLPCRSVSEAMLEDDVELHTVPIEVRVLGPVGGQVVLNHWSVVANLSDATVPDSRAPIEADLRTAFAGGVPIGGVEVEFRAAAGDPEDPLTSPPDVWVDGVLVSDAEWRQEGNAGSYVVRLPRGLSTRHASGSSLAELTAPKVARITFTGVTRSGRNSVGRLSLPVEKDRSNHAEAPELQPLFFGTTQALPVTRPVAIPHDAGSGVSGTLVSTASGEDYRAFVFTSNDTWQYVEHRMGGWIFAFTERGQIVWQDEAGIPQGMLQTDLSHGAPNGPLVTLPSPAMSDFAFRLGNGSVCIETLEPSGACPVPPSTWEVQCLDAEGAHRSFDLNTLNTGSREAAMVTVGLQEGWLSAQYRRPDCPAPQVVGGWDGELLLADFRESIVDVRLSESGLPVLLSAGAEQAVVGSIDLDNIATLELIDVAGNGASRGHYFAPPASPVMDEEDAILWADAEGALVILRSTGELQRWLPDQPTPAQTLPLGAWTGRKVLGIYPNRSLGPMEQVLERPVIAHSNGDVTAVLALEGVDGQPDLLVLELSRDLVPVWAHVEPLPPGTVPDFTAMPVGLPDGPYIDVATWGLDGPMTQLFRWAR